MVTTVQLKKLISLQKALIKIQNRNISVHSEEYQKASGELADYQKQIGPL